MLCCTRGVRLVELKPALASSASSWADSAPKLYRVDQVRAKSGRARDNIGRLQTKVTRCWRMLAQTRSNDVRGRPIWAEVDQCRPGCRQTLMCSRPPQIAKVWQDFGRTGKPKGVADGRSPHVVTAIRGSAGVHVGAYLPMGTPQPKGLPEVSLAPPSGRRTARHCRRPMGRRSPWRHRHP